MHPQNHIQYNIFFKTFQPENHLHSLSACLSEVRTRSAPSNDQRTKLCLRFACQSLSAYGQAFDLLVAVSSMHCCTSTPALSTSSSSRGLTLTMGYLILRGASRLDAFSVYPFPTWLPGHAPGGTTGAPVVSPTRSSRTKVSSPQISCARAG